MAWSEQVFRYCERAQDPSFWAEPLNAVSNVAFLAAAGVVLWRLVRPSERGGAEHRALVAVLAVLVAAIGVGSFLFHTFATRWARTADVAPIGLFMVAYLVLALRAWLGWSWTAVAAALLAFLVANGVTAVLACPRRLVGIVAYVREPCLNETASYLPALATLALVATLVARRHPAGGYMLAAAGIFVGSLLLRWIDLRVCPWTALLGRPRGTHALWHILNAATLYVLLAAAFAPVAKREQA